MPANKRADIVIISRADTCLEAPHRKLTLVGSTISLRDIDRV